MWLSDVATFLRQWPCWKEPIVLNRPTSTVQPPEEDDDGPQDREEIVKQLRIAITSLKASFMSEDGSRVDYQAMLKSPQFESFSQLTHQLRHVHVDAFTTQDRLKTFFINVYNSLTVHALIHQAGLGRGRRLAEPQKLY